jgi:hypothetical protein
METQTGLHTSVVQSQVAEKHKDLHLLEYLCKTQKKQSEAQWRSRIQDGFVTVDCEVVTDCDARLDTEYFLEDVDERVNMGTQTGSVSTGTGMDTGTGIGTGTGMGADTGTDVHSPLLTPHSSLLTSLFSPHISPLHSPLSYPLHTLLSTGTDTGAGTDATSESKSGREGEPQAKGSKGKEAKGSKRDPSPAPTPSSSATSPPSPTPTPFNSTPPGLERFVSRAGPLMIGELERASRGDASGLFSMALSGGSGGGAEGSGEEGGVAYWKCFSVDLEKHKVGV